MDWFSTGVQSMSEAFGGKKSQLGASNPFTQSLGSLSGSNPFTQKVSSGRGNPFTQGMPTRQPYGGIAGYQNPLATFERNAQERIAKMQESWQGASGATAGGTGQSMGQATAAGGNFASMDDASGEINSASAKFGVPANLIKSIIFRESSGDWGRDGNRYVHLAERGTNISPYSGITDPAARAWGYDPKALIGNRALQIEAVANGLNRLYQDVGGQYGWDGVIATYYSGDPTAASTPSDSYQYGTTQQYLSQVKGFWSQLDQSSGSTGTYNAMGAGAAGSWMTAFGGGDYPITQEHGPTAFSLDPANAWMYDYAAEVGVQGHPGVDVGMATGTKIYAPAGGTVVIAGGSGYYRDENVGDGPGRGELRLQLDNGDIVILGHMSSISATVGSRINAGAYLGNSGSFNGSHLHYEVRTRTPGATSSGYTAVDPRTYFGGGASLPGQPAPQTPQQQGGGLWWQQNLSSLFRS